MHCYFRDVHHAFRGMVDMFSNPGWGVMFVDTDSRNGPVRMIDEPVTITFESSLRRVLNNPYRDANPFFHVVEALWMLDGRNDLATLQKYVSTFDSFSDDGETLNGAYGYRWRHAKLADVYNNDYSEFGGEERVDQLTLIVDHLLTNPNSRRAVLQMWNVEDDLLKVGYGYKGPSRDVCCNLSALFALKQTPGKGHAFELEMTVFNRSNDLIWGLLGANVVHFTFLQEYLAARLSARMIGTVEPGKYHQVTNNLHVYLERFNPQFWKSLEGQQSLASSHYLRGDVKGDPPPHRPFGSVPLVKSPTLFDSEVRFLLRNGPFAHDTEYNEPFLAGVAIPMMRAFDYHKQRSYVDAYEEASKIQDAYWSAAAIAWLDRRERAYREKVDN